MEDLNCGNKKAVKLLNELDSEYGLIERKRQGQGKPTRIYVKDFSTLLQNRHFQKCQNDTSKSVKTTSLDVSGRHSNKTEINNTEFNKINPIYPPVNGDGDDGLDEYKRYRDYFLDQLEFDVLLANHPYDGEVLNEILELLVETVCAFCGRCGRYGAFLRGNQGAGNRQSVHQGEDGLGHPGEQAKAAQSQPHQSDLPSGIGHCQALPDRDHCYERARGRAES